MENNKICGVILAAGMSTRMGTFKPLLPLKGKTVIENTIDSMLSGGADSVVIVVGYRGEELVDLIDRKYKDKYRDRIVVAWNYKYETTDMLYSLQIGVRSLPECEGFFLLPGDMPLISTSTFIKVLEKWKVGGYDVVFPTLDGHRKHPPLVSNRLIPEILDFHGEGGVREIWKRHEALIGTVEVLDRGVWIDLDTPKDYDNYKKLVP
jgi:CTP:molybdopterin cytidylyltransferase MocA